MRIIFQDTNHFVLQDHSGNRFAELIYASSDLKQARLLPTAELWIENTTTGTWHSYQKEGRRQRTIAEIRIGPAGLITLHYITQRRKYKFKSSGIFKTRFTLFNNKGDEILALLPMINWGKQGHEFSVQVNEEYGTECTSLLILHAVHCANCCLGILNGTVPAQVSI